MWLHRFMLSNSDGFWSYGLVPGSTRELGTNWSQKMSAAGRFGRPVCTDSNAFRSVRAWIIEKVNLLTWKGEVTVGLSAAATSDTWAGNRCTQYCTLYHSARHGWLSGFNEGRGCKTWVTEESWVTWAANTAWKVTRITAVTAESASR